MSTDNPLLSATADGIPHYDRIEATHVVDGIRSLIAQTQRDFEALAADPGESWDTLMVPYADMREDLDDRWGAVQHLMGVRNSDDLRSAYEAVEPEMVALRLAVGQSRPLFDAMCRLRDRDVDLDETRRRILTSAIRSAQQAGVALEGPEQERFAALQRELAELSTTFSNHVLDATKAFTITITDVADIDGLPADARAQAAARARDAGHEQADADHGPWVLGLDMPSFLPAMQHLRNSAVRERLYRGFITRASEGEWDNGPLIDRILALRREQAALLGYDDYVALSLSRKMATDVQAVLQLIERLSTASHPAAVREHRELQEYAAAQGHDGALMHWDLPFWAERLQEERYAFSDEEVRPYFPLDQVLEGLFGVVEHLFGVRIVAADGDAPVWHKDVRFFRVRDAQGQPIAGLYLDPYARPHEKRSGAWMDVCVQRRRWPDGTIRLPVAHLVCNGSAPVPAGEGREAVPSLMSFREVETLFHECGHGLQHILTTIDEPMAAGLANVEWDAVEIASQFMEYWAYERDTFFRMARHYQTGKPLDEAIYQRIRDARSYRAGWQMMRQLGFAKLDLALHADDGSRSVNEIEEEVDAEMAIMPRHPDSRFLCSFGHIFSGGYAAGYYSYKWSEVYAADCFAAFEEAGVEDAQAMAQVGRHLRDTLFALGGSRHPLAVYREFRGHDAKPDALLRHNGLGVGGCSV